MKLEKLQSSTARWRAGEFDDACYAALYFLHWQSAVHGKRFASRRHRTDPRPDPAAWLEETASLKLSDLHAYLLRFFERYQFLGIIDNVPVALAAWLRNEWPLTLYEHIPTPVEVLVMQVEGTRPVTVLSAWPRMLAPVLSKPNAFAFMTHDLEHAWKFFHNPSMHRQQRDFFRLLSDFLENGRFDRYLNDPAFVVKFDYLSSDMNTHVMHASQFLRAILVEFHMRQESVRKPEELSRPARDEISALLVSLLGTQWLAEVESRMIQQNSKPVMND
jgi:hypothetical protein